MIADGAMGTQLQSMGLRSGIPGELWNVEHPDFVYAVHRSYIRAGAELLLTNTFGATRIALERHGLGAQTEQINEAAVSIALRAGRDHAEVFGDIGPFGGFLAPLGDVSADNAYFAFLEQANVLVGAGVHGIMIETMSALDEIELAVRAARTAGATRIVASLAYDKTRVGMRTMMGVSPTQAAELLTSLGVDILGVNCGTGLSFADYASIIREYRSVDAEIPISVKANAGSPRVTDGGTLYAMTAYDFGMGATLLAEAGAEIIGGCCGTTPDHIRAVAEALPNRFNFADT